jgi:hypothetical protein
LDNNFPKDATTLVIGVRWYQLNAKGNSDVVKMLVARHVVFHYDQRPCSDRVHGPRDYMYPYSMSQQAALPNAASNNTPSILSSIEAVISRPSIAGQGRCCIQPDAMLRSPRNPTRTTSLIEEQIEAQPTHHTDRGRNAQACTGNNRTLPSRPPRYNRKPPYP